MVVYNSNCYVLEVGGLRRVLGFFFSIELKGSWGNVRFWLKKRLRGGRSCREIKWFGNIRFNINKIKLR